MTAYAANRVGEDMQGLVQGVIAALSSVAAVVAPLLLTGVFEAATDGTGAYFPGAPFLLAGVMVAGIVPLVWRMRGK
jgi:DHA1 family tetracycline resistance protein-like MFS transporter